MNKALVLVVCLSMTLIAAVPAIAIVSTVAGASANETEKPSEDHDGHETKLLAHRLAFFTGNTLVPDGKTQGGVLVVPTFGLDYQYWFSHRFGAMASFEIELLDYQVETNDESFIERDTPIILAVQGIFEAVNRLALFFGPGVEFEHNESLWVVRLGGEYKFPVQNDWDLSIVGCVDFKEEYWVLTAGLSIGKRFGG